MLSFLVDGGLKFKFVNIGKLQGFFFVCDRRSVKLFLYDKQFHGRKTLQTVVIVFESATLQKILYKPSDDWFNTSWVGTNNI